MKTKKKTVKKRTKISSIVDTQREVAKNFEVSVRCVRDWVADGMPVLPGKKYDLAEIRAWKIEKEEKKSNKNKESKEYEKKYQEFRAKLKELEYKKRKGELLELKNIESGRIERILEVKKNFLSLPKYLAPQLVGLTVKKIESVLDQRIKEVIKSFEK